MQKSYHPRYIERIVQKYWDQHKTFSVTEDKNKQKYYCLSMLPYPSGKLHMGHVRNYTIGDVISRYQRMLGKNVLQPIGWDAFGLPAEQAAITNKIDPKKWTYSNISYMRDQLKSLGFSYDWNRELITCQSRYYRWEQWFFTILYKKGLVYKKTALINWCPYHNTVLANEQVINNCCWRCHTQIQYKKMPQWFIKITNYAEQLLIGLDQLQHWPEQVKIMQRNWIGRSEGINVTFKVINSDDTIVAYLNRLDTFMGITYLTISIDHPIALKLAKNDLRLADFIKKNSLNIKKLYKNNFVTNNKTGIPTYKYAIHPMTNEKLPIWIANFIVPIEFGGIGIIASCPAHNQQDWEFANQYELPIKPVIKDLNNNSINITTSKAILNTGILFNSDQFNGLTSKEATDIISKVLINNKLANFKVTYKLKDWGVSRQRYWGVPIPMVTLEDGTIKPVLQHTLPIILPKNLNTNNDINHSLKQYSNWIKTKYKNHNAYRDTDTFDTFIESSWYYARYTCPDYNTSMLDTDAANYWLPIDQYIGGIEHAIMHLMYFRFYHKLMRDAGLIHSDEPAIRLLCQGMILADSFYYFSHSGQKIWVSPCDTIIKRDTTGKIIKAIDKHGNNLTYFGTCKMSKSKNNGIDPKKIIQKYGADAVRFFIMFAAPASAALEWKQSGIEGAYRFLNRLWNMIYQHIQKGPVNKQCSDKLTDTYKDIRYKIHKTIIKVTDDIDRRQSFNTALAEIMKLFNNLQDFFLTAQDQDRTVIQEGLLIIVRLLYPFTPHISFILWKELGEEKNIDYAAWPTADYQIIKKKKILIIIQINGKKKKVIYVPQNSDKNTIYIKAKQAIFLNKSLMQKKIYKIIYIPNKIINFLIT